MSEQKSLAATAPKEAPQVAPQTDPVAKRPWTRPLCRPILWMHETANSNNDNSDGIQFS